ncbi:MAG: hypothetical protein WDW38_002880 [Sanguina aurantia]
MSALLSLPSLSRVQLLNTPISPACCSVLGAIRHLTHLEISFCPGCDSGGLAELRHLAVARSAMLSSPVPSTCFAFLSSRCPALTSLDLARCDTSPGLLPLLANLPCLSTLKLCSLVLKDTIRPTVPAGSMFRSHFQNSQFRDPLVFRSLTHLSFSEEVHGSSLAALLPQPELVSISLPRPAPDALMALSRQRQGLVTLSLGSVRSPLATACVDEIRNLESLNHLTLRSFRASGTGKKMDSQWLGVFEQMAKWDGLRVLMLKPVHNAARCRAIRECAEGVVAQHRPVEWPKLAVLVSE